MKKFVAIACVIAIALMSVSCATVNVGVAKGDSATLVNNSETPKEVRSKMVWYAIYGLIPLGDNSTEDLIKSNEKVTVKTYASFLDYVISAVLGIVTVTTRTVEVEVH